MCLPPTPSPVFLSVLPVGLKRSIGLTGKGKKEKKGGGGGVGVVLAGTGFNRENVVGR